MTIKQLIVSSDNTCKFCGHTFKRATTLTNHMCVKKQRDRDKNSTGTLLGYVAFDKFYKYSVRSTKTKTMDDFINSEFYIDFTRFGHQLARLRPLHMENYIDFVIRSGVSLKEWGRDELYELYIKDLLKKEPAESATERTIQEIMEWSEKNNFEFNDFFRKITANEAAYLVQTGRISPWVLYLSSSGEILLNKFNADHTKMIGGIIDPIFWKKKFKNNEDVDYITTLLDQVGL